MNGAGGVGAATSYRESCPLVASSIGNSLGRPGIRGVDHSDDKPLDLEGSMAVLTSGSKGLR